MERRRESSHERFLPSLDPSFPAHILSPIQKGSNPGASRERGREEESSFFSGDSPGSPGLPLAIFNLPEMGLHLLLSVPSLPPLCQASPPPQGRDITFCGAPPVWPRRYPRGYSRRMAWAPKKGILLLRAASPSHGQRQSPWGGKESNRRKEKRGRFPGSFLPQV